MNAEKEMNALDVYNLSVNYEKTPALWDVSLHVPAGNLIGVIGPNGAGKSTFLKAVLGQIKPLSGKIEFFEQPLAAVRNRVAYVPQRATVDWDFPITVLDLVLMGRYGRLGLFRWPGKADYEAAQHYLNVVGMSAFTNRQINQLSGGQQQRVFIARALLQEADIYFMDEPFAGIDAASEAIVINLLKQLKDQGKTVFVVHHDLNTVQNYFDWAILLNMRLIVCGHLQEVFTPENLHLTYGRNYALFDEALRLSQSKTKGLL